MSEFVSASGASSGVVIPRIRGGLGNQLFMYAMARRLAAANGVELALDDVSGFRGGNKYARRYMLDRYAVHGRRASAAERLEPGARWRRRWRRALDVRRPLSERRYVVQREPGFDPAVHAMRVVRPTTFEGYWQSERWFDDMRERIRAELTLPDPADGPNAEMLRRVLERGAGAVALHVRFFNDPAATAANEAVVGYYRRALEHVRARVADPHFFLFSDEPEAARSVLSLEPSRLTPVTHNRGDGNAHLDLWLISRCRHVVTANSTFSWWGAWLGESADGFVVTPDFAGTEAFLAWGSPGLIPARWTRIRPGP